MPNFYSRAIMSALVANGLISATSALALANFTPRIENLPARCQAVYTTQIQGCQAGDFSSTQGGRCSSQCVNGLVTIMRAVETACAGVDVPETSVIGVFLLGLGVQTLCPGIEVVTLNPSSTTQAQTQQPATSQAQTTTKATSSTAAIQTQTTSTLATTISSSGISVDTTVPTTFSTRALPPVQSASPSPSPSPKSTATLQKSNADSGGGSPFDVVATGSSLPRTSLRSTMLAAALGAVAMAFAAL